MTTSREVIIAPNFKMAASHQFCQCYRVSDEGDKENSTPKGTEDAIKFGVTLCKS